MADGKERVLLAIQRVGGRGETTQIAGQLGISKSEALAALRSLEDEGRISLVNNEWIVIAAHVR